jgi:hypothetical protein
MNMHEEEGLCLLSPSTPLLNSASQMHSRPCASCTVFVPTTFEERRLSIRLRLFLLLLCLCCTRTSRMLPKIIQMLHDHELNWKFEPASLLVVTPITYII